jgi:hypothetical protein
LTVSGVLDHLVLGFIDILDERRPMHNLPAKSWRSARNEHEHGLSRSRYER